MYHSRMYNVEICRVCEDSYILMIIAANPAFFGTYIESCCFVKLKSAKPAKNVDISCCLKGFHVINLKLKKFIDIRVIHKSCITYSCHCDEG